MEEDGLTLLLWQRLKRVNNLSPLNSNHQQLNTPCYAVVDYPQNSYFMEHKLEMSFPDNY